ncbi:hypothetical protein CPB85DRAFT_1439807 [Mucidula mucida]|nr:hypothetical protein CPB85DRAFT_1442768 [Mucidula mucida]KAF8899986.1 hypothetical protein CPB85DRAFT_1439800 [Mucidula mucida]KAF8899994.1 hypothetical protein CPB85DRAFT_1439807 [Mucidula mucida]
MPVRQPRSSIRRTSRSFLERVSGTAADEGIAALLVSAWLVDPTAPLTGATSGASPPFGVDAPTTATPTPALASSLKISSTI